LSGYGGRKAEHRDREKTTADRTHELSPLDASRPSYARLMIDG
jgi:hypothetical protein